MAQLQSQKKAHVYANTESLTLWWWSLQRSSGITYHDWNKYIASRRGRFWPNFKAGTDFTQFYNNFAKVKKHTYQAEQAAAQRGSAVSETPASRAGELPSRAQSRPPSLTCASAVPNPRFHPCPSFLLHPPCPESKPLQKMNRRRIQLPQNRKNSCSSRQSEHAQP